MAKHFILADDLTGSNATAALLHNAGVPVITVVDPARMDEALLSGWESVVCNARSRLLAPERAAAQVSDIVARVRTIAGGRELAFAKRIDSTLRGPLGSEIEAFLTQLPASTVAVVVPAYPSSGRTVRDGHLFVHGVLLHQTEMAFDPATPIQTSNVMEILQQQTKLPIRWIRTGEFNDTLPHAISQAMKSGARIIGCDAESDTDIARIAEACVAASGQANRSILPVDPGPFTAAFFTHREKAISNRATGKVLVVSGSLMETARRQLQVLLEYRDARCFALDIGKLDMGGESEDLERIVQMSEGHSLMVLRTDQAIASTRVASSALLHGVGTMVARLMERVRFQGLYVSGGETAATVLSALEIHRLRIVREIEPLCVLSTVVGGRHEALHVVTKGGGVGSERVVLDSVSALS